MFNFFHISIDFLAEPMYNIVNKGGMRYDFGKYYQTI